MGGESLFGHYWLHVDSPSWKLRLPIHQNAKDGWIEEEQKKKEEHVRYFFTAFFGLRLIAFVRKGNEVISMHRLSVRALLFLITPSPRIAVKVFHHPIDLGRDFYSFTQYCRK
jgi:hypothetical protein